MPSLYPPSENNPQAIWSDGEHFIVNCSGAAAAFSSFCLYKHPRANMHLYPPPPKKTFLLGSGTPNGILYFLLRRLTRALRAAKLSYDLIPESTDARR